MGQGLPGTRPGHRHWGVCARGRGARGGACCGRTLEGEPQGQRDLRGQHPAARRYKRHLDGLHGIAHIHLQAPTAPRSAPRTAGSLSKHKAL